METEIGVETEGKSIQKLSHVGLYPIYCHETQTLLWMPASACWQEPDRAVSWEVLPQPDKYRCLQATIGLIKGSQVEELEKGLKEMKEFATP